MKLNPFKYTFVNKCKSCPPVSLNGVQIPQADEAKYLGVHLDRRLTWKKHIIIKRKQKSQMLRKMYWLLSRKLKLSIKNKILLYKECIIKPVWIYRLQLWGAAANSNIEIVQRYQSKILRIIVDASRYITNEIETWKYQWLRKKSIKQRINTRPDWIIIPTH